MPQLRLADSAPSNRLSAPPTRVALRLILGTCAAAAAPGGDDLDRSMSSVDVPLSALIAAPAVAGMVATLAGAGAIAWSHRAGFLDRPGAEAHKQQAMAVPYGGGAAVALGLLVALIGSWLVFDIAPRPAAWAVAGGALALFAVGLRDDWRALSARAKLAAQLVIAAIVVPCSGLAVDHLAAWPLLAHAAAIAWIVLVSNSYNLIDHADGVSSTTAIISSAVLLAGCLLSGDLAMAMVWATLIGALLGFLRWNLPPARLYLGDAGSLPLGFLVGVGTLSVTFWPSGEGGSALALLAPLLITALPLFDTGVVVIKRLRRGAPLLAGDRHHISHRLGRLGLTPRSTLAVVAALQVALAGSALQLRQGSDLNALLVIAQAAAVLLAVLLLETNRDHG